MRKVLSLAALMSGISFGMTGSVRDAYTEIVQKWAKYSDLREGCRVAFGRGYEFRGTPEFRAKEKERDAAKPERFDQAILHRVILEEVGEDVVARQMLQMLYERKLHDVPYFYLENADGMTPENREKFKELLLFIAPIINVGHASLVRAVTGIRYEYLSEPEYRPHVDKIVSIWGGNADAITFKAIRHPQFCHKVLTKITLDLDKSGSGMLFQSFDTVGGDLAFRYNWPDKRGEISMFGSEMPDYEEDDGYCHMSDVWRNWSRGDLD
jgi:hypothetical protein